MANDLSMLRFMKACMERKGFDAASQYVDDSMLEPPLNRVYKALKGFYTQSEAPSISPADLSILVDRGSIGDAFLEALGGVTPMPIQMLGFYADALSRYNLWKRLSLVIASKDITEIAWDEDIYPELVSKLIMRSSSYKHSLADMERLNLLDLKEANLELDAVKSGWRFIDQNLDHPFTKGGVHLFMGFTKDGKSTWLENLFLNIALLGYNVLFLDREQGAQLTAHLLVSKAGLDPMDKHSLEAFSRKLAEQTDYAEIISAGMSTAEMIIQHARQLKLEHGIELDAIIDDHINVMPVPKASEPRHEHEMRARFAKRVAEETNTAYITAWQMAASGKTRMMYDPYGMASEPDIFDLAEAKVAVGQHVSSIWSLVANKQQGSVTVSMLSTRAPERCKPKATLYYNMQTMRLKEQSNG